MILQTFVLSISLFTSNTLQTTDPYVEKSQMLIHEKDLDGDGVLCKMECTDDLLKNFELIDLNADLFLNEDELATYLKNKEEKK